MADVTCRTFERAENELPFACAIMKFTQIPKVNIFTQFWIQFCALHRFDLNLSYDKVGRRWWQSFLTRCHLLPPRCHHSFYRKSHHETQWPYSCCKGTLPKAILHSWSQTENPSISWTSLLILHNLNFFRTVNTLFHVGIAVKNVESKQ